ncbi:MAG TPA: 50S ribosomal protein L29 [Halanaerobiales bacterium]|nr:50S ribosomal protein L29 [Halanaerobiales bacterium]
MRADELRNLTEMELDQKLREFKEELFNLRFQHATAQLDNPTRIREVRRIIARIKTIKHEQELGINQA